MRDAGRSDAYAAEDAAFEGTVLERRPGGPALEAAVCGVLGSGWWRAHVGDPAAVRRVRVRAAGDSHWAAGTGTLAIDPDEPWYVVTHELAHVADAAPLAGGPVHGAAWRGWDVTLVTAVFGEPFGRLLADSFARHRLPVHAPRAAPPPTPLAPLPEPPSRRGGWRPT